MKEHVVAQGYKLKALTLYIQAYQASSSHPESLVTAQVQGLWLWLASSVSLLLMDSERSALAWEKTLYSFTLSYLTLTHPNPALHCIWGGWYILA